MTTSPAPERTGWSHRLARELREHPFAYLVMACFVAAGPVLARLLFPEAPPSVGIVGGMVFGGFAALCAVPGKFF